MTRSNSNGHVSRIGLLRAVAKGSVLNLYEHWALACFSLVAAFGLWFVIEDVENPRVEGFVPAEGETPSIRVEATNTGDYIVTELQAVRVKVEAREGQLEQLVPTDFRAEVDMVGAKPGVIADVPVRITAQPDGVRIIEVIPSRLNVTVVEPATRQIRVDVTRTGPLPTGYRETDSPTIDPPEVTIRGLPELVESVTSVNVDVNLSGVRESVTLENLELVAHSQNGNAVTVSLSKPTAKVSFKIEQTFTQRVLSVRPPIVGSPAPGFMVGRITIDPQTVPLSGTRAVMDGLEALSTDAVDVGGARSEVRKSVAIQIPPNTALGRPSANVSVTVEIKPIECTSGATGPCGATTFQVAPEFGPAPPGLRVEAGNYTVPVRITGPLPQILDLKAGDGGIRASVALTGGQAGPGSYPVTITVPSGLRAEPVAPLAVTLVPVTAP